ncbi:hypothetical protein GIB67_001174 [Kingdonia uniflora]|uniref:Uncharacterized protein n=1 Tax=Kingdonia uniflora TaxID=39325 RepID=A0A7J7LGB1_9MAGN|nr:hypothetical protein GIB67_001174 [Kingdonia uniflora]
MYSARINYGNDYSNPFELENHAESQSDHENSKFENPNLKDLYTQTFVKCVKLGKTNKVLKNQVNTLALEVKEKVDNRRHEIKRLEGEKQGLHKTIMILEKDVHDAREKIKSTLDKLDKSKLDLVYFQHKLKFFSHGAKHIDKMLSMGKTDSDNRGLGYEDHDSNAKTPQVTKFVKTTIALPLPKHNVSTLPRGYPSSKSARGVTTAGLVLNRLITLIARSSIRREVTMRCAYRV